MASYFESGGAQTSAELDAISTHIQGFIDIVASAKGNPEAYEGTGERHLTGMHACVCVVLSAIECELLTLLTCWCTRTGIRGRPSARPSRRRQWHKATDSNKKWTWIPLCLRSWFRP